MEFNKINNIVIREETPNDYESVEHLTMRAFWNIHGPGCSEHLLVRKIRKSKDYLPNISRIAEWNGKVVGAIYYTKAKVVQEDKEHEVITFGPLSVEPTLQNLGIGKALLEETIQLAKNAGYSGIIITGEPMYYPKRGFITCDHFNITDSNGINFEAFMGLPLNEEIFKTIHGKFFESSVYSECNDEEEKAIMDSEFPGYRKIKIQDGFLMLFDKYFGVIESIEDNNNYKIKFWEKILPAKLDQSYDIHGIKPIIGDDILFRWKKDGTAEIVSICKNLLE